MMDLRHTIPILAAGALCCAALPLAGCLAERQAGDVTPRSTINTDTPVSESDIVGSPGGGPPNPAPPDANSPEAAQTYADCLTDAGVPAIVVEGDRVVRSVEGDQSGAVSEVDASEVDASGVEQRCAEEVPEYTEPSFNER